jgi:hypothetical protein
LLADVSKRLQMHWQSSPTSHYLRFRMMMTDSPRYLATSKISQRRPIMHLAMHLKTIAGVCKRLQMRWQSSPTSHYLQRSLLVTAHGGLPRVATLPTRTVWQQQLRQQPRQRCHGEFELLDAQHCRSL